MDGTTETFKGTNRLFSFMGAINLGKTAIASVKSNTARFTSQIKSFFTHHSTSTQDRTITAINLQKNGPAYDHAECYTPEAYSNLLANLHRDYPNATIAVIKKFSDLSKLNLTSNILLKNDNFISEDGVLFSNNPNDELKLIIDFTAMDPSDRIEMHQIFDKEARIGNKALGNNVTIYSVIDASLLKQGQRDFWRRVIRGMGYFCEKDANAKTNQEFFKKIFKTIDYLALDKQKKASKNTSTNNVTINFANKDWKQELIGGPSVDEQGKGCFTKGKLANLKEGQTVTLLNAPWSDDNFNNTLRQIITRRYYVNNDEKISLPSNIIWQQANLESSQIPEFKRQFKIFENSHTNKLSDFGKCAIINNLLFSGFSSQVGISESSKLIKQDPLKNCLSDVESIIITDKLTDSQWKHLLYHLQEIGKQDLPIIQYDKRDQPRVWRADSYKRFFASGSSNTATNNKISFITEEEFFSPSTAHKHSADATVIHVYPDTNPAHIVYDTRFKNIESREVEVIFKPLFTALKNGGEVVITNIEHNPALQKYMETLLGNPPYLMINGCKHIFNNGINLTFVASPNAELASTVLQEYMSTKTFVAPTLAELKTHATTTYPIENIDPKLYDNMVDQLDQLVKTVNATLGYKELSAEKITLDEFLIDKVWKQALQEQRENQKSHLSVAEFQKAINTVILKSFRQHQQIYYFFKYITRHYFPTEAKAFINTSGLKDFASKNSDKLTAKFIEDNIWSLLKFFPELSYLEAEKLDFPVNKAKSEWLVIRVLQAIFNCVIGLLVSAVNTLLVTLNFKKKNSDCNQLKLPEATLLSIIPNEKYSQVIELVKAEIVSCVAEEDRFSAKIALDVSDEAEAKAIKYRENWQNLDTKIQTTLRDLLYYSESLKIEQKKLSKLEDGLDILCHKYALEITQIKNSTQTIAKKETKIKKLLTKILPEELLAENKGEIGITVIVNFLLSSNQANETKYEKLWVAWQARRNARANSTFQSSSAVMFLGDAATGKTRLSLWLAKQGPLFVFNASPNSGTSQMFGENTAERSSDGSINITFNKNAVLQWAEYQHEDKNCKDPITLFIDEATLLPKGFLDSIIRSINSNPKHISINGQTIYLGPEKKIVLAGNLAKYANRIESKTVKHLVPTITMLSLPEEYKHLVIAKPMIEEIVKKYNIVAQTSATDPIDDINYKILFLFNAYSKNLPKDYDITARDLHECCMLLDTYLWTLQQKDKLDSDNITVEMLSPVIERAVRNAIGGRAEKDRWKLEAIKGIFNERFVADSSLDKAIATEFDLEYQEIELDHRQTVPESEIDFDNKVTKAIGYSIWIAMKKREKEIAEQVASSGRRYLEIAGDAGIGKDVIISIFLRFYKKKFQDNNINTNIYNVGPSNWNSNIVPEADKAFRTGGILAMSEVNCIPSNIFEGKFNPLLDNSKKITPGFLVIASKNHSYFTARYESSAAAKSRSTLTHVDYFDSNDLISIHKSTGSADLVKKMVMLHCKMTELLIESELAPKPSLDQLENLSNHLKNNPNISDAELLEAFGDIYSFYINIGIKRGKDFKEKWQEFSTQAQKGNFELASSVMLSTYYKQELSHWLTQKFRFCLPEATYVMQGHAEDIFDTKKNYIYLSVATLEKSFPQQQAQVFAILINKLWRDQGAPEISQQSNSKDSLLYKQWLQKFAASKINFTHDNPYLNVESLFPISEIDQKALNAIDSTRKELLETLYKLDPSPSNIAKAKIIFEGKSNSEFTATVKDIIQHDSSIFERLIRVKNDKASSSLLTVLLNTQSLKIEYLQDLISIFKSHPKQLEQILDYLNTARIESYCVDTLNRKKLQDLLTHIESFESIKQQELQDKVDAIKNAIDAYANQIVQVSKASVATTASKPSLAVESEINKILDGVTSSKEFEELFNSKSKRAMLSMFTGVNPFSMLSKMKSGSPNRYAALDMLLKMIGKMENIAYKANLKKPVSFDLGSYAIDNGFKMHSDITEMANKSIQDSITNDIFEDLAVCTALNYVSELEQAVLFFDKPEVRHLRYTPAVERLHECYKNWQDRQSFENIKWSTINELLKHGYIGINTFLMKYIFIFKNIPFAPCFIANVFTNGLFNAKQVFELLTYFVEDINSSIKMMVQNKKINLLMNVCGNMLELCLHNLQKGIHIDLSNDIVDGLLKFKFLQDHLSSKGANALAGMLELNLPIFHDRIESFLHQRYECVLTQEIDIKVATDTGSKKAFEIVDEKNLWVMMYKTKNPKSFKRSEELCVDRFIRTLEHESSKHMQETIEKFFSFKSVSSWDPSDKINIQSLIKGEPFYEHDAKDVTKSETIFIASSPVIATTETMGLFYHKPSGSIINLRELITGVEHLVSNEEVLKFLEKNNITLSCFYREDAHKLLKWINSFERPDADRWLSDFVRIPTEAISKAIYGKMLKDFGSLTFCILSSDKTDCGYATVNNEVELQKLIDHYLTTEKIHASSLHGLDNVEYYSSTDKLMAQKIIEQEGDKVAIFTTTDLNIVSHEMITQTIETL
jgi:hypothetical protein